MIFFVFKVLLNSGLSAQTWSGTSRGRCRDVQEQRTEESIQLLRLTVATATAQRSADSVGHFGYVQLLPLV